MNCQKCNATIPDGARFCQKCGAPVSGEATVGDQPSAPTVGQTGTVTPPGVGPQTPPGSSRMPEMEATSHYIQPPYQPQVAPAYQRTGPVYNPMCIASLAVGVASLVFIWGPFLGIVAAIAGVVLGVIGMRQVDENPEMYNGRGLAAVGIVVSIVGGVSSLLFNFFVWFRWWWL